MGGILGKAKISRGEFLPQLNNTTTSKRPLDRMALLHRIVDIRDSSYPALLPIVLTPDEIKQRLEVGDQFIEGILARGEALYARQ